MVKFRKVRTKEISLRPEKRVQPVSQLPPQEGLQPGRDIYGNIVPVGQYTKSDVSQALAPMYRKYAGPELPPESVSTPKGTLVPGTPAYEKSPEATVQRYIGMTKTPEQQRTEQTIKNMTSFFERVDKVVAIPKKWEKPVDIGLAFMGKIAEPAVKINEALKNKNIPLLGDLFPQIEKD